MGEEKVAKKDLIEALSRAGYDLQRSMAVKKGMVKAIDHLLERAKEAALWRDVVYLLIRMPVGILTFTLAVALITIPLSLVLSPIIAAVSPAPVTS